MICRHHGYATSTPWHSLKSTLTKFTKHGVFQHVVMKTDHGLGGGKRTSVRRTNVFSYTLRTGVVVATGERGGGISSPQDSTDTSLWQQYIQFDGNVSHNSCFVLNYTYIILQCHILKVELLAKKRQYIIVSKCWIFIKEGSKEYCHFYVR